ncbi:MAG: transcription termination factor Rho, partial [Caldilineaceae bacterium]|nr:transcription termination factor Rho [Caldilineaceae bacterium]
MSQTASGVLEQLKRGGGFLRAAEWSFQPSPDDVFVPVKLIRQYGLVEGAQVSGPTRRGKKNVELSDVESVCGLPPADFQARTPFDRLVAIDPN